MPTAPAPPTTLPARLSLTVADSHHLGTILYRGAIPPTNGEWYGVEWDEPGRGRHDGVHDATGVRYFNCRVKGAGTFLRPNAPGLSLGTSFPRALLAKYSPTPVSSSSPSSATPEGPAASTFYETASNFAIEVTSLAKIEDTFRNLGRLREAGLEWEGVSYAGEEEERRGVVEKLVRLEILNLSFSLIPSYQVASRIVAGLPKLRVLALNSNRFEIISTPTYLEPFARLTELQLNQTLVSWAEILLLSPSLPSLVHLQLGANRLATLSPSTSTTSTPTGEPFPHLEVLNFAENELGRWDDILTSLADLPRLARLILTSNKLETLAPRPMPSQSSSIPPTTPTRPPALRTLRHLSLSHNLLASWSDVDALNDHATLPLLESLSIEECAFGTPEDELRLLVIARVGSLVELDGSKITEVARKDAELYYLSSIAKESFAGAAEEQLETRHPRWRELLQRYGQKPATELDAPPKRDTIRSKLIHLIITFPTQSPPLAPLAPLAPLSLALLPTLPTRVLRTQIAKALGWRTLPKDKWRLWAILRPDRDVGEDAEEEEGPVVEIPPAEEGREVGWWGLGEGDEVQVLAM